MLVRGFHLVLSNYGFWLPNDPRGSGSDFVRKWELFRYGSATKVDTRRSVAGKSHDRELRLSAKRTLEYPEVRLTGRQAVAVAHGFDLARRESGYVIYACAILPEHSHLVVGEMKRPITQVMAHLKGRATQALVREGLWPKRPVWGRSGWKVFLFSDEDMRRAIRYVEGNPLKEGKREQTWSFVTEYSSSS